MIPLLIAGGLALGGAIASGIAQHDANTKARDAAKTKGESQKELLKKQRSILRANYEDQKEQFADYYKKMQYDQRNAAFQERQQIGNYAVSAGARGVQNSAMDRFMDGSQAAGMDMRRMQQDDFQRTKDQAKRAYDFNMQKNAHDELVTDQDLEALPDDWAITLGAVGGGLSTGAQIFGGTMGFFNAFAGAGAAAGVAGPGAGGVPIGSTGNVGPGGAVGGMSTMPTIDPTAPRLY
jgi:hypothetical protein